MPRPRCSRVPPFVLRAAFAALLAATLAGSSYAQIYVDASCGDDAWTGASPTCAAPDGPKRTLQASIDAATGGEEIIAAMGTYVERIDLLGKTVTLRGTDPADSSVVGATVIDATGLGGSAVTCTSGEGPGTLITGFTVSGGSANVGGGMRIENSSPTISHCTFNGNSSTDGRGGGMYISAGSPTVTYCIFRGNFTADPFDAGYGGGLYSENGSPTVSHCTFSGNHAGPRGGGASIIGGGSAQVSDCVFDNNYAYTIGGMEATNATVVRCTFRENSANFTGGLSVNNSTVTHCAITDNDGGGMSIYNATVANCLVTGNNWSGAFSAAGVWGRGTLINCTVIGNLGYNYRDVSPGPYNYSMSVRNCIIGGATVDSLATLIIAHSDVVDGLPAGATDGGGNIYVNPQFVGPGDRRLQAGSPCIDAGNNADVPGGLTADLDGNPRIQDGDHNGTATIDMGAYEYQSVAVPGVSSWGLVFLVLLLSIGGAVAMRREWQYR